MLCGATTCHAVRCCAVLSFAFFRTYGTSTRYRHVRMCSSFRFLHLSVLARSSSCFFFSQIIPVVPIRTWHRQQAHRTAQGNQLCAKALGIIESLVAPNTGPLISAPFAFICIPPCVSVAGGISRSRSGALVHMHDDTMCCAAAASSIQEAENLVRELLELCRHTPSEK